MDHDLKCWPGPFEGVVTGQKTHEVRKDDRGYSVGDTLKMREWDPDTSKYTGRACRVEVTYISRDAFGLPSGLIVMSIRWPKSTPLKPQRVINHLAAAKDPEGLRKQCFLTAVSVGASLPHMSVEDIVLLRAGISSLANVTRENPWAEGWRIAMLEVLTAAENERVEGPRRHIWTEEPGDE